MATTVEMAQNVFTRLPSYSIALEMIGQTTGMPHQDVRSAVDYLLAVRAVQIETCTCRGTKHFYYRRLIDAASFEDRIRDQEL